MSECNHNQRVLIQDIDSTHGICADCLRWLDRVWVSDDATPSGFVMMFSDPAWEGGVVKPNAIVIGNVPPT